MLRDLKHKVSIWKRNLRFKCQYIVRGWADSDTWNLDTSLAKVILPRLKRFKDLTVCSPMELDRKTWESHLDKMIASFDFFASEKKYSATLEEYNEAMEGIKLFAEYYSSLWY